MNAGDSGESSIALLSSAGALIDWNAEFAVELAQASAILARGVDYLTLVDAGLGEAALAAARDGFGEPRRYRYVRGSREVEVHESRTAGGDILRVAAHARPQLRAADEVRTLEGLAAQRRRGPEEGRLGPAEASPSRFAATVSHELRTPMQGVLGMASLLLRTELDHTQRAYLGAIDASGRMLLSLINDIIAVSEMGQGSRAIRIGDLDLVDLVEGVVGLLAARARDRGLEIQIAIDPAVPRVIRGDALRLRQVLLNILGNAIKFTARGSIAVRVGVTEAAAEPRLRFEIEDSGVGIDPAAVALLFHRGEGEGVGLALSRSLVERMGGRIGVASQPEVGSTFWFELPFAREEAAAAPAVALAGTRELEGLRLLIVEDNEVNLAVIEAFVVSAGGACDLAVHGNAAIEACAQRPYDVVIMDIHMPGIDGLTASQIIRAARDPDGPPMKIIAITADARPEVEVQAADVGMDGWIAKPFHRDQLVLAIRAALGGAPA